MSTELIKDDSGKTIAFVYKPEKYYGPIAIDATPSEACKEYHRNAGIQINIKDGFIPPDDK